MSAPFKKTAIRGLLWSVIDGIGAQGLRFVIGIILARLLAPEIFGLLAMLLIFITLGEILVDSGFGAALIQKQEIGDVDICSIFYFNVFLGLTATALLFISAPIIAAFYGQPSLTALARVLSPIFFLDSFGMIQMNLLLKRVDFKSLAKLHVISNSVPGIIGIALAFLGCGLWSLVAQQISSAVIRNLLFWFYSSWRPNLLFSFKALGKMLKFGLSMLGTGVLNRMYQSIYYMVIGKLFSPNDLGLFSRADQIQGFPGSTLAMYIGGALFPVLSKVQNNPVMLKSGLRKTLIIISSLIIPMMIGLAVVAKPFILVLLTDKWTGTIPYLQLLSIVGMLYPLEWLRQRAIQAIGRSDLSLKVEIIKKCILFASIAIMWHWGILGIIYGMIFASLLSFGLNVYYVSIFTEYSIKEQLLDMLPYVIISIFMGLITYSVMYLLNNYNFSPFYQLVGSVFCGIFCYIGINLIFHTTAIITSFREIRDWLFVT